MFVNISSRGHRSLQQEEGRRRGQPGRVVRRREGQFSERANRRKFRTAAAEVRGICSDLSGAQVRKSYSS